MAHASDPAPPRHPGQTSRRLREARGVHAPGRVYRRLTAPLLAFLPEQAIITPVTPRRLIAVLVSAVLIAGALATPASARLGADTSDSSLVSKGRGTQTFEGGGLIYGTVARNATIFVVNLSGLNDLN